MRLIYAFALFIICPGAAAEAKRPFVVKNYHQYVKSDTDTIVRKQSLSVGIMGGSDAMFFGRTSPKRYRYYTADVIYNAKSGFFAYGTIWKVSGSYPTLDEVDVGGGYIFHLTKKLGGTASYTHFFFNRDAQIIKSASTNNVDLKTTYDWKLFKTSIAADYLFGKANDVFLTPSISRYYETKFGIFDDKDYLSFTPGISMILGTQNFVEHYTSNERDAPNPDAGFGHETDDLSTAHANRQFNVLNYSFKLPIAYNRPHYTLEANTRYSIPVNVEGQLKNHKEVFFTLTFYYLFY
jgi:hypothetical protein